MARMLKKVWKKLTSALYEVRLLRQKRWIAASIYKSYRAELIIWYTYSQNDVEKTTPYRFKIHKKRTPHRWLDEQGDVTTRSRT